MSDCSNGSANLQSMSRPASIFCVVSNQVLDAREGDIT